ncbi:MAG TPA: hypothetical protein VGP63_11615 [Planctomycetaceae bacterium]|nr:hypothetical protein [Planctomycetaceae bacterium]
MKSYVEGHSQWPTKWDDLRPFLADVDSDPKRLAAIPDRVHVDFMLKLKDVAAMSPETFSAVEPTEPNFGIRENDVADLLEVIRSRVAFNAVNAMQIPASPAKDKGAAAR